MFGHGKYSTIARSAVITGIAISMFLGLTLIFDWSLPWELEGEALVWLVATVIPMIPIVIVLDRLEKEKPPHEGYILATMIFGSAFITFVSAAIMSIYRWMN